MFECLYGYTPFACDDRHKTKLKILKHKSTFGFPEVDHLYQPSHEAMDVILQLLVEKEKRLCTRRYRLNDYTTQIIAGRPVKFATDKHHKNYNGYFVYPDDADDLKHHPFFAGIHWSTLQQRRPPFVPKVLDWEDTKYFDEDQPISDIDEASSDDDAGVIAGAKENKALISAPGSKASQHHQEDHHIVPSVAIQPSCTVATSQGPVTGPQASTAVAAAALAKLCQGPSPPAEIKALKQRRKEKKRPRDKILRDPDLGRTALELRKDGAFMGYSYSKPQSVEEILNEVMDAHTAEWQRRDEVTSAVSQTERL